MMLAHIWKRWWPPLVLSLTFTILGLCLLPYPGLEDDETLFANVIFHIPGASQYDIIVFHHPVPMMILSYLGTVKAALFVPLFALFQPSVWVVRLPPLFLGVITIWVFFELLNRLHGRAAACIGTLLLSTHTMFLLTTVFDWGPVAIQNLLLVSGLALLAGWWKSPKWWRLFSGFFCFGLAMWDKALFIWVLSGIGVAALAILPRQILKSLRWKNVMLAGAAFCLGALPLIKYNFSAHSRFATYRSNAAFKIDEVPHKLVILRRTYDGSALLAYMVAEPSMDHAREARNPVERISFALRSIAGEHRTSRGTELAFCLAVLLLPLLWRSRARSPLLFFLIAMLVAWAEMVSVSVGGGSAHHAILIAPLVFAFLGITYGAVWERWGAGVRWITGAGVGVVCVANLLVTNQNLYQFARYGAAGNWSDAIYSLSAEVERAHPGQIVIEDWGLMDPLVLLHRGRLDLATVDTDFLNPGENIYQRNYYERLLQNALWLGHTPAYRTFTAVADTVVQRAAALGYRKEVLKTVPDSHGREVYEMFRFTPPASTPAPPK